MTIGPNRATSAAIALADLDVDGDVEIIMDTTILNGSDGSIQATLSDPASQAGRPRQ